MRPSPEELLTSARHSLRAVVIPAIDDKWARYVASAVELVLEHVQLRIEQEPALLRADNADMLGLLREIEQAANSTPNEPHVAGVRATAAAALTGGALAVDAGPAELTAANEHYRSALANIIDSLNDGATAAPGSAAVERIRHSIREVLLRQVGRQEQLARPLFMSFAPPVPATALGPSQ